MFVFLIVGVSIVNFFLATRNLAVTLGGKSPEPVSFATETTLRMIIVQTTGVFPVKVFCTKCTEEEFVIAQVLR